MIWLKAYLIGCLVAAVLCTMAVSDYMKKANVTRGTLVIYFAVIVTSWFGLIVTAATFIEETEWGKKIVIRNRHIEEE